MSQNNGAYSPQGLSGLLQNNRAREYFQSLPDYVQEMITQRRDKIKSEDELRRYAENILEGDK